MAEVFDYAEGIGGSKKKRQLERVVALHFEVQKELDFHADMVLARAMELYAERRNSQGEGKGNSYLEKDEGDVDRGIWLVDPPRKGSPGAAWEIEHGHQAPDGSWVDGKWVLHDASGIPRPF